jgi:hypothetical protein
VQKDDEYFRTTLAIREEGDGVPAIERLRESVFRDLARERKRGLRRAIDRTSHRFTLYGPSGEPVVDRPQFLLNESRIKKVIQRIVIGIHYGVTGQIHNRLTRFRTFSHRELDHLQGDDEDLWFLAMDTLRQAQTVALANDAFCYRFALSPLPEGIRVVVCWTEFYGRIAYLTVAWRPLQPTGRFCHPRRGAPRAPEAPRG